MRGAILILLVVVSVACDGVKEEVVTLAELDRPELAIVVRRNGDAPGSLEVELVDRRDVVEPCPILPPDFTVTIGDVEVPVLDRGGWMSEFDGANECRPVTVAMSAPPEVPGAVLVLEDRSARIACELEDALLPRAMFRDSWELAPGETIAARWSPASDLGRLVLTATIFGMTDTAQIAEPIEGTDQIALDLPQLAPRAYELHVTTSVAQAVRGDCGAVDNTLRYGVTAIQPFSIR